MKERKRNIKKIYLISYKLAINFYELLKLF